MRVEHSLHDPGLVYRNDLGRCGQASGRDRGTVSANAARAGSAQRHGSDYGGTGQQQATLNIALMRVEHSLHDPGLVYSHHPFRRSAGAKDDPGAISYLLPTSWNSPNSSASLTHWKSGHIATPTRRRSSLGNGA
jgi:hypothetical protein